MPLYRRAEDISIEWSICCLRSWSRSRSRSWKQTAARRYSAHCSSVRLDEWTARHSFGGGGGEIESAPTGQFGPRAFVPPVSSVGQLRRLRRAGCLWLSGGGGGGRIEFATRPERNAASAAAAAADMGKAEVVCLRAAALCACAGAAAAAAATARSSA